jgi:hypothetical protein
MLKKIRVQKLLFITILFVVGFSFSQNVFADTNYWVAGNTKGTNAVVANISMTGWTSSYKDRMAFRFQYTGDAGQKLKSTTAWWCNGSGFNRWVDLELYVYTAINTTDPQSGTLVAWGSANHVLTYSLNTPSGNCVNNAPATTINFSNIYSDLTVGNYYYIVYREVLAEADANYNYILRVATPTGLSYWSGSKVVSSPTWAMYNNNTYQYQWYSYYTTQNSNLPQVINPVYPDSTASTSPDIVVSLPFAYVGNYTSYASSNYNNIRAVVEMINHPSYNLTFDTAISYTENATSSYAITLPNNYKEHYRFKLYYYDSANDIEDLANVHGWYYYNFDIPTYPEYEEYVPDHPSNAIRITDPVSSATTTNDYFVVAGNFDLNADNTVRVTASTLDQNYTPHLCNTSNQAWGWGSSRPFSCQFTNLSDGDYSSIITYLIDASDNSILASTSTPATVHVNVSTPSINSWLTPTKPKTDNTTIYTALPAHFTATYQIQNLMPFTQPEFDTIRLRINSTDPETLAYTLYYDVPIDNDGAIHAFDYELGGIRNGTYAINWYLKNTTTNQTVLITSNTLFTVNVLGNSVLSTSTAGATIEPTDTGGISEIMYPLRSVAPFAYVYDLYDVLLTYTATTSLNFPTITVNLFTGLQTGTSTPLISKERFAQVIGDGTVGVMRNAIAVVLYAGFVLMVWRQSKNLFKKKA